MDTGPAAPDPPSAEYRLRSTVARGSATTDFESADFIDVLGLSPDSVPGYTLLRRIGGGAQGQVYLALQSAPRRKVAIKIQREISGSELSDAARFEREIDALARLRHPNIVAIHASGTTGEFRFYVMDYLSGVTLAEWLERRSARGGGSGLSGRERASKPTIGPLISLFRKICNAVYAAHARGITHRDLKPTNIRVDADGEPHILDFGLAKMSAAQGDASTMTLSGVFIGSVPWSSPEQAAGENDRVDPRSDVYSLGVLIYQAVTGEFPYSVRGGGREVLDRVIHDLPIPPRKIRPDLDGDLETILLQCLAKDRERRYADAGELGADLARYQGGEPIAARRDSVAYLLATRARRALRQRPIDIHLGVQAGVALAVSLVILALGSTKLDLNFRRAMIAFAPGAASWTRPQHVRLIALRDPKSIERMAAKLELTGVRENERWTHRALHGKLMERLAEFGVRVVVWDYDFLRETDFDGNFVTGVQALAALDPPVRVLALTPDIDWTRSSRGRAEICEAFGASGVVAAPAVFHPEGSWETELVYQDAPHAARESVQLAAFAAYWAFPQADSVKPFYELDVVREEVRVSYLGRERDGGSLRELMPRNTIPCTALATKAGLPGKIGVLQADIPTPSALGPEVLEYESIFFDRTAELVEKLKNRVVVIGDARPEIGDWHSHPRLGPVAGCYVVAAGIEALIAQSIYLVGSTPLTYAWLAPCIAMSAWAGWALARRPLARVGVILGLTALSALGSFLAYAEFRVFLNPATYFFATVLSVEAAAWLCRRQPLRGSATTERG